MITSRSKAVTADRKSLAAFQPFSIGLMVLAMVIGITCSRPSHATNIWLWSWLGAADSMRGGDSAASKAPATLPSAQKKNSGPVSPKTAKSAESTPKTAS